MNNPEIKKFIREHSQYFWYTPEREKENINPELLLETILNYGDMDAVRGLFKAMGIKNAASVFFGVSGRKKMNYYPEIYHYFSLLFKRHA
jgi:hypothetical protein